MRSEAGRAWLWRIATRNGGAALVAAVLGGCASGRPEVTLPDPRTEPVDTTPVAVETSERSPRRGVSVVMGDIRFTQGGAVDLGATVVSLRPRGQGASRSGPGPLVVVEAATPEFAPELRIVRPGQSIVLDNRGPLVHRVFSPQLGSRVLDLPPGGRSEPFTLGERGPARFYCSLHADERFLILAEDAPHVALVSPSGTYRFGPLEAGRYTLSIWSERVSGPIRDVFVDGYSRTTEPIWLDPALIGR